MKKISLFREPGTPPPSATRQEPQHIDIFQKASEPPDSTVAPFLHSISHELRTPLAAIQGFAQLLNDEINDQIDPHHVEFFSTILRSVHNCMQLIDDLTDFAQMEEGELQMQMGPVDVNTLVRAVARELQPAAADRGIFVHVEAADAPGYAHADELRLRHLLTHLIRNGIKYTNEGGVTVRLGPGTHPSGPAVNVDVSHSGSAYGHRLLPDYHAYPAREARMTYAIEQGTGIGMAVGLEYLTAMGGTLTEQHVKGERETFTLSLLAANL